VDAIYGRFPGQLNEFESGSWRCSTKSYSHYSSHIPSGVEADTAECMAKPYADYTVILALPKPSGLAPGRDMWAASLAISPSAVAGGQEIQN